MKSKDAKRRKRVARSKLFWLKKSPALQDRLKLHCCEVNPRMQRRERETEKERER